MVAHDVESYLVFSIDNDKKFKELQLIKKSDFFNIP